MWNNYEINGCVCAAHKNLREESCVINYIQIVQSVTD